LNAQVDNHEAERLGTPGHVAHARVVQFPDQHGVRAPWFDVEISERRAKSLNRTTTDGDPMSIRVHTASCGRM